MSANAPPRHLVAVLLAVVPLSQIPLDIYTPALPQMVADLQTTSTAMQNTVTAYMLGLSVGFIPVGVPADAWGRRRVLLTSLVLLVAASLLCAVAGDVTFLLAVRFLQGLAACACMVLSYAIAADCFRDSRLVILCNRVFLSFVVIFGLMASAQLAGCGVLCPQLYGQALGLFTDNLGLVGGIVTAGAYLIVTGALAVVGVLPETTQAPLGLLYVFCGLVALPLLARGLSVRRTSKEISHG